MPQACPTRAMEAHGIFIYQFQLSFMDGWLLPGEKVPRAGLPYEQLEQAPCGLRLPSCRETQVLAVMPLVHKWVADSICDDTIIP